jgi:hypothetical protein
MKEVNSIVVGSVKRRIIKNGERQWCEIFESNDWKPASATKLHELLFDVKVYDWLNRHHNSTKIFNRAFHN